jgi:hypothetical protein
VGTTIIIFQAGNPVAFTSEVRPGCQNRNGGFLDGRNLRIGITAMGEDSNPRIRSRAI